MLKISYKTKAGEGTIVLDADHPDYQETLSLIEQSLADTGATDIVYEKNNEPYVYKDEG